MQIVNDHQILNQKLRNNNQIMIMIKIFKNNVKSYVLHEVNSKHSFTSFSSVGNRFQLNPNLNRNTQVFEFVSMKQGRPSTKKVYHQPENQKEQKQQVLKTYLQIIPPYRLQQLLHPEKSQITQFVNKPEGIELTHQQLIKLQKKIKKYVHMIPVEQLGELLAVISGPLGKKKQFKKGGNQLQIRLEQEHRLMCRKIYTKILAMTNKKLSNLSLEQIINFVYQLVKNNYKQFEFMKQVERIIIEQKIKINYPLIRKILWSYTHLDVGSSVLYAHICKTIKIGQHQLHPLQIAEAAYMLSKCNENASGGYGIFAIAQKHLLVHFPRLSFSELVKAASFMLTQNIGTNQFQMQLQSQLYKKYPDKPNLRINQLVILLKSTSAYYFKFKDKALLNLLLTSTYRLAPEANLQQFEDIVWSWGRSGKGDHELWKKIQEQINKKYINLLKPRQLAFFYFSLCSTEYSSDQAIKLLQNKFIQIAKSDSEINEHYLLKFLLGMQKRKVFPQHSFTQISQMIIASMEKLSVKQLVTFIQILNESDLCYQNKNKFKQIEDSLIKVCEKGIGQKIYLFNIKQIVQILYMWIKLDIKSEKTQQISVDLKQKLFSQISHSTHQIPKSVFIKALFCFTISDKYKQSIQMIVILEELLKFGPVTYFFSPFQLPLMSYCVYHFVVNGNEQIKITPALIEELGQAIDKINPIILNKFVRNGYEQCVKLKNKYESKNNLGQKSRENKKDRNRTK